ncbi:MAG: GAF domain-containing sensor histidine kinase [Deltaproteobacteria bacterium]|nr:GAF domain-containing sensor histidine kinase [Deltaproteobacteria bacterium]
MALRGIITRITQREKHDYRKVFRDSFSLIHFLKKPSELFDCVAETIRRLFNAHGAALLLKDEKTRQLVLKAAAVRSPLSYCIPFDHPFLEKLVRWGKPLRREEMLGEPLFVDIKGPALRLYMELQAEVLIPLIRSSGLFGLVTLGRREVDYDGEDMELLSLLSQEIGISIENAFLYEEVLRQNAQLKELSQLKDGFIANTTHELTTPLHQIIGLADAIVEGADGPVTEEQRGHLQMISDAGERLLKVIQTLLNISALEKTSSVMEVKKINLAKLLQRIMAPLEAEATGKGTRWEQHLARQGTWIFGDEEKIQELFHKVLENAVQKTAKGTIEIRTEKAGEMVKICVRDTGPGIPFEDQRKIFEEFGQAGETMTRGSGTGLGLAIAKKIVELHGGRIWVESMPGFGSEFYFTLPTKPSLIRSQSIS